MNETVNPRRFLPFSSPTRSLRDVWSSYVEFHARAPFKLYYIALIGILGFPFYGFVWTYVFPQPYENWTLRLVGSLLCAGVLVENAWPSWGRRYFLPYCYVALALSLPAFFTFMLLMNNANPVWLMSTMAAMLFVLLLYDVVNAFVVIILGSLIGIAGFWIVNGVQDLPTAYLASFPIYLFANAAVLFLSYGERRVAREQLQAAYLLASKIAHEMRTPLLGITFDSERLREDFLRLAEIARWSRDHGWQGKKFSDRDIQHMETALNRIRDHTFAANLVIDMLLTTVAAGRSAEIAPSVVSLQKIVATALDRFHFRGDERQRVVLSLEAPALVSGPEVLLVHVLFNLLKNALNAINDREDGRIDIRVYESADRSILECRDNGRGIEADLLPYIFMPFVTGGRFMHGTGVGLPFCKFVIESCGGTIACRSRPGHGAVFVIALPKAGSGANQLSAPQDVSA